jgi:hypothetical protein
MVAGDAKSTFNFRDSHARRSRRAAVLPRGLRDHDAAEICPPHAHRGCVPVVAVVEGVHNGGIRRKSPPPLTPARPRQ